MAVDVEVHGGLIGEYRKGLFEAVTNFAVQSKKTRFFVPSSDYTRPSRFAAHLQEQNPYQVVLTTVCHLWQKFITSMMDIFEESLT